MARAPWEPREGETEEERETRLAADDVHRRLEQARLRELEEAYWRSRATSSAPDADSAKRNVVGARSATPRATLAGVRDAAPSTRARASTRGDNGGGLISDLEVQELARAASRVGATPDVSRRVAEEVLAAERVAVDAAMRRASARRSSARAGSSLFPRASTPRTRPVAFDTPADAETATKASRSAAAASRRDPRGGDGDDDDDDDDDDDASAGMTSALWDMARTPGPERPRGDETRVSRKTSFLSPRLGDEIEIDAVAAAAASRARGAFGGGDPLSSRRARAAFSQAAAAAVEDGLRKLVARTNESPKKGGAVAAMAANARLNAHTSVVSPTTLSSRSRAEFAANASAPSEATRRERSPSSPSSASGTEEGDEGDEREREEKAWLSEAAFAREDGDDDASADETRDEDEDENESRALWLEEDLRAVRAAHAAARRAEDAAARLEADECAARLATTAAVARLLDARVALAAATARAVSEEAATTAATCAAEAASLRLTLDDEVGPSGDRGVGTCEALAEALSAPLSLPKISSNVRGGKRRS